MPKLPRASSSAESNAGAPIRPDGGVFCTDFQSCLQRRSLSALQVDNDCGTHSAAQGSQVCHCGEAEGRRGALSAKHEEVPLGCNLGKAVTFSPGLSCYPTGYCEIATAPLGPRNDNSGVHTILLLAMTRQEGARCTSALLRLNHPRTRRSGSAATGWLWVPAILMAARSKRRCGPAKDESYIFSKNGLFSQSLHNQIAPLGGQHICQPCHLHQPHNTHSP